MSPFLRPAFRNRKYFTTNLPSRPGSGLIRMALLLWVLPQWFGNVLISGAGMYLQHAGCVAKSSEHPYGHSNSSLSRVLNFTMFNVGYHTHHHEHPQVHWAQLPRLHEHMRRRLSVQRARLFRVAATTACRAR